MQISSPVEYLYLTNLIQQIVGCREEILKKYFFLWTWSLQLIKISIFANFILIKVEFIWTACLKYHTQGRMKHPGSWVELHSGLQTGLAIAALWLSKSQIFEFQNIYSKANFPFSTPV